MKKEELLLKHQWHMKFGELEKANAVMEEMGKTNAEVIEMTASKARSCRKVAKLRQQIVRRLGRMNDRSER
jgi:hypothetical protein